MCIRGHMGDEDDELLIDHQLTFDLGGSVAAVRATESFFRLLLEQLLTNRFGLFGEFRRVRFGWLTYPPVHLFTLHFFLASTERCLSFNHLVDEATEAEEVRTEAVLLIIDHFGSYKEEKWRRRVQQRENNQRRQVNYIFFPCLKDCAILYWPM